VCLTAYDRVLFENLPTGMEKSEISWCVDVPHKPTIRSCIGIDTDEVNVINTIQALHQEVKEASSQELPEQVVLYWPVAGLLMHSLADGAAVWDTPPKGLEKVR
jgi:hypothetical protein